MNNQKIRIAPYTRHLVWDAIFSFTKKAWKALLVSSFLPTLSDIPIWLFMRGNMRVIFMSIFSISGLWFTSIIIVLWSGAADKIMGLQYESVTAESLRKLEKHGWKILNGIKIRGDGDIDHVAIGPSGVLVFETKWSSHKWATEPNEKGFKYFQGVIWQVGRNRTTIKESFRHLLAQIPVKPVCILWSAVPLSHEKPWFERDGVTVVLGPNFEDWLESLKGSELSSQTIEEIWSEVTILDRKFKINNPSNEKYNNFTFSNFLYRYFIFPMLVIFLILTITLFIIKYS